MTELIEITSKVHGELAISLLFNVEEYNSVAALVPPERKNVAILDKIAAESAHRNYNTHACACCRYWMFMPAEILAES